MTSHSTAGILIVQNTTKQKTKQNKKKQGGMWRIIMKVPTDLERSGLKAALTLNLLWERQLVLPPTLPVVTALMA